MLKMSRIAITATLASITLAACMTEQDPARDDSPIHQIRSAAELDEYLRTASSSPLDRLAPVARQQFVTSLVFTENGLGGFSYTELEGLSATEAHEILSLFGAERTTPLLSKVRISTASDKVVMQQALPSGDHKGYRCIARATCEDSLTHICMSSC
jgi:hypothetical protein